MSRTIATRVIDAPIDAVFNTVADVRELSKALTQITGVEFLSPQTSGAGTRYRQTRGVQGKAATYEMEVTEFVKNDYVRVVTKPAGTVWDTVFAVEPAKGRTRLTLTMEGRTNRWASKILNLMIGGMLKRAVERDMDLIKASCEAAANGRVGGRA